MNLDEFQRHMHAKLDEIKRFQEQDLPDIVGKEAVDHFNQSFKNEGFTDQNLEKWKDVKRRDPNSEWYGFSMENKDRFSPTRAADKILTGESNELQNSITYKKNGNVVSVGTDKPYAAVHQFGLEAKIFGKKAFQMIARPFIGKSAVLEETIYTQIKLNLERILKK